MYAIRSYYVSGASFRSDRVDVSAETSGNCGKIGVTFCPGKHDRFAVTGIWARNLDIDLDIIKAWGATLVLTLLETLEMIDLKVPTLGEEIQHRGMKWVHLPITDYSVPDDEFEQNWLIYGKESYNFV